MLNLTAFLQVLQCDLIDGAGVIWGSFLLGEALPKLLLGPSDTTSGPAATKESSLLDEVLLSSPLAQTVGLVASW